MTLEEAWSKMVRYRLQNRKHLKKGFFLKDINNKKQIEGMREELIEIEEESKGPPTEMLKYECADLMVILMDFCIRNGFSQEEMAEAISKKLDLRFGEEII